MYKRILAPVDGSPTSTRGLQEAIKLAKSPGTVLRLLHVVDESVLMMNPEALAGTADVIDAFVQTGKQCLKNAAALAKRHGIKSDSVLYENMTGRVADFILKEARKWKADVIVMGTHGRRGFSHVLLGSDAEAVVRNATVPVLLVRGKKR